MAFKTGKKKGVDGVETEKKSGVNGVFFVGIKALTAFNREKKAASTAINRPIAALTVFKRKKTALTAFNRKNSGINGV